MTYFDIRAAQGRATGIRTLHKFGRNLDVDTAAAEDLWNQGGDYTFPAAAEVVDVVSDDANDTSAGTGARTLTIEGLDANYAEISETISMNGVTPVATSAAFLRVFRAYVATAGTNLTNAGTITGDNTTSSNVLLNIQPDEGQTLLGVYTVPANCQLLMTRFYTSAGKQAAVSLSSKLMFRPFGGAFRVRRILGVSSTGTTLGAVNFTPYLMFEEKTDIKITVAVSANNADVNGGFDGYLVGDA